MIVIPNLKASTFEIVDYIKKELSLITHFKDLVNEHTSSKDEVKFALGTYCN